MKTVNYTIKHNGKIINFDWEVLEVDNASDKPHTRKHWDNNNIVELLFVTGTPKKKTFTFGIYRTTNGTFRDMM